MKLYMRVQGTEAKAWSIAVAGTASVDTSQTPLELAVAVMFSYADKARDRVQSSIGGDIEYRAYTLLAPIEGGYALVEPNLRSVRECYPEACRVVNINTGVETQLCIHQTEGLALLHAAATGETVDAFA
ncbi:hypothetical protein ACOTC5_32125 [Achromobacter xylosoxidans]